MSSLTGSYLALPILGAPVGEVTQFTAEAVEIDLLQLLKEESLLDPRASYVIQAGYFEAAPDPFSNQSLLRGLSLKELIEPCTSNVIRIVTLHNDIGASCDETCVPLDLGKAEMERPWQVPIIREKTALNRGLRFLRKELKKDPSRFVMETGASGTRVCLRTHEGELIALAIQRDANLIALCPLILASFYEMLVKDGGKESVVIDFCHYNEVQRVGLAVQVLNQLFLQPEQRPRALVAVALDNCGNNLTPILF